MYKNNPKALGMKNKNKKRFAERLSYQKHQDSLKICHRLFFWLDQLILNKSQIDGYDVFLGTLKFYKI